eukprot:3667762-Prymnesium_polylepis.1
MDLVQLASFTAHATSGHFLPTYFGVGDSGSAQVHDGRAGSLGFPLWRFDLPRSRLTTVGGALFDSLGHVLVHTSELSSGMELHRLNASDGSLLWTWTRATSSIR